MLPLILGLALFVVQLGLIVRDQVLVVHAAREGARAGAVLGSPIDARRAVARSSDLDDARTAVSVRRYRNQTELIEVTVTYRSPTSVPVIGALLGDVTVRETVTMRVESGT